MQQPILPTNEEQFETELKAWLEHTKTYVELGKEHGGLLYGDTIVFVEESSPYHLLIEGSNLIFHAAKNKFRNILTKYKTDIQRAITDLWTVERDASDYWLNHNPIFLKRIFQKRKGIGFLIAVCLLFLVQV